MVVINSLPCFCFAMHMRKRSGVPGLEAQVEVSVNQSGTLNESKPKEQHEFSGGQAENTYNKYRDSAQVMVYL